MLPDMKGEGEIGQPRWVLLLSEGEGGGARGGEEKVGRGGLLWFKAACLVLVKGERNRTSWDAV